MKMLLIVLAVLVLLALVLIIRTLAAKPTEAVDAKIKLDESERADEYGRKLAEMVRI